MELEKDLGTLPKANVAFPFKASNFGQLMEIYYIFYSAMRS